MASEPEYGKGYVSERVSKIERERYIDREREEGQNIKLDYSYFEIFWQFLFNILHFQNRGSHTAIR